MSFPTLEDIDRTTYWEDADDHLEVTLDGLPDGMHIARPLPIGTGNESHAEWVSDRKGLLSALRREEPDFAARGLRRHLRAEIEGLSPVEAMEVAEADRAFVMSIAPEFVEDTVLGKEYDKVTNAGLEVLLYEGLTEPGPSSLLLDALRDATAQAREEQANRLAAQAAAALRASKPNRRPRRHGRNRSRSRARS